jgi:hypothetical protein
MISKNDVFNICKAIINYEHIISFEFYPINLDFSFSFDVEVDFVLIFIGFGFDFDFDSKLTFFTRNKFFSRGNERRRGGQSPIYRQGC